MLNVLVEIIVGSITYEEVIEIIDEKAIDIVDEIMDILEEVMVDTAACEKISGIMGMQFIDFVGG
jgi:hypothetical protein